MEPNPILAEIRHTRDELARKSESPCQKKLRPALHLPPLDVDG
jgi:hypothetical protein